MSVYTQRVEKIEALKGSDKVKAMSARIKTHPAFADQLRAEMTRAGITVMELCAATGISFDTMTRYRSLKNAMEPTRGKLLMIADAIGCPMSRLTAGPTPPLSDKRVNRKQA